MAWLALAYSLGVGLSLLGAPLPPAPLALLLLLAPIRLWRRPGSALSGAPTPSSGRLLITRAAPSTLVAALLLSALAGAFTTSTWLQRQAADCRLHLPDEAEVEVVGRFLGRPADGASPFQVEAGLPGGCTGVVRAFLSDRAGGGQPPPSAGVLVRGVGRWRGGMRLSPLRPEFAGHLALREVTLVEESARAPVNRGGALLRFRGGVQDRIVLLYGERAPLVEALILARREGLKPEIREAFAISGTAHLLAISGFHVGVVAGLLFSLARALGQGRRAAGCWAAGGCWLYVLSIGAPHAAARAAMMLTLLAIGQLRGRPVSGLGALSTALLFMLVMNPGALAAIGFQLSFAGAAGLILFSRPLSGGLRTLTRGRLPKFLLSGISAGTAATLATLPLIVWHFDRVSLVGVPATLVLGPLLAAAIPGIFVTLALSWPFPGIAAFLAGGIDLILRANLVFVGWLAAMPGASPFVPRWWIAAITLGACTTFLLFRGVRPIRPAVRRVAITAGALGTLLLWPLVISGAGGGSLDLHFLDVGQGDALAIRSPLGRWMLIDAGPSATGYDAGERVVAPFLRRRGVRRVEMIVLTHPHLDHIGGARAVLREFEVGSVVDPGLATGSLAHIEILKQVGERKIGFVEARAGGGFDFDGVRVDLLHPHDRDLEGHVEDPNDVSVVLLVRYGEFTLLLTGDAPASVERELLGRNMLPRLTVLKAGHHGSRTSTSWELVQATAPEAAILSLGHRNRYGHPHAEVVERLQRAGTRIFRTDRQGTILIRGREDGSHRVWTERGSDRGFLSPGISVP